MILLEGNLDRLWEPRSQEFTGVFITDDQINRIPYMDEEEVVSSGMERVPGKKGMNF